MDVVMIHGTTQSAAGWDLLGAALGDRGHRWFAVDLPTDRPDWSARDYADEVVRAVGGRASRPVLVGHSGAGLMLPPIARALTASRIVWIAAAVPDPAGRPFADQATDSGFTDDSGWPIEVMQEGWKSYRGPDAEPSHVSASFLFHDCDPETQSWALETLQMFAPIPVFTEEIDMSDLPPSLYVAPTEDRTLNPAWMRRAAANYLGVTAAEVPGGHCPHVSRPAQIAALVDQ